MGNRLPRSPENITTKQKELTRDGSPHKPTRSFSFTFWRECKAPSQLCLLASFACCVRVWIGERRSRGPRRKWLTFYKTLFLNTTETETTTTRWKGKDSIASFLFSSFHSRRPLSPQRTHTRKHQEPAAAAAAATLSITGRRYTHYTHTHTLSVQNYYEDD